MKRLNQCSALGKEELREKMRRQKERKIRREKEREKGMEMREEERVLAYCSQDLALCPCAVQQTTTDLIQFKQCN